MISHKFPAPGLPPADAQLLLRLRRPQPLRRLLRRAARRGAPRPALAPRLAVPRPAAAGAGDPGTGPARCRGMEVFHWGNGGLLPETMGKNDGLAWFNYENI